MFFKCKHPFESIVYEKLYPEESYIDDDAIKLTWRFQCIKCGINLTKSVMTMKDSGNYDRLLEKLHLGKEIK